MRNKAASNVKDKLKSAIESRGVFFGKKLLSEMKPIFKYKSARDQFHYAVNLPLIVSELVSQKKMGWEAEQFNRIVIIGAEQKDIFDDGKWFSIINSKSDIQRSIAFAGDSDAIQDGFKVSTYSFVTRRIPEIDRSIIKYDEICESDYLIIVNTCPLALEKIVSNHTMKPGKVSCLGYSALECSIVAANLANDADQERFDFTLPIGFRGTSRQFGYHSYAATFNPEKELEGQWDWSSSQRCYESIQYAMIGGATDNWKVAEFTTSKSEGTDIISFENGGFSLTVEQDHFVCKSTFHSFNLTFPIAFSDCPTDVTENLRTGETVISSIEKIKFFASVFRKSVDVLYQHHQTQGA
jgi:hypothetical protein